MTKNEKISKSLKKYYRTKRTIKSVKRIMLFITVVMWVSFIIGVKAEAPETRQWGLPVAEDRTDLTVADQIRIIARAEGHSEWADYLVKLSYCESRHNPGATNGNGNNPVDSVDRGLFQYNSYWQSQVSDECAYDITCSTKQTIKMIEAGKQHRWVCDKYVKGVPLNLVLKLHNIYTTVFQLSGYDDKQLKEKEDVLVESISDLLKDLKEECVGLEWREDEIDGEFPKGCNHKRQEVLEAFNKRGITPEIK